LDNYKRHLSDLIPSEAREQAICSEAEGRDRISLPAAVDLRRWGKPFSPLNFQEKIIEGIKGLIDYGPVKGLLALPTGSGKTLTTCRLVLEALCHSSSKKKNVIWLAPQRELLYQASEAFQAAWWAGIGPPSLDIRIVKSKASFSVSSRPTCWLMTPKMAEGLLRPIQSSCDIAIFDEAHHTAADVFLEIWSAVSQGDEVILALGLSATPSRENGNELPILQDAFSHNLFLPRLLGANPIETLINDGVLARPVFCLMEDIPLYSKHKGHKDQRAIRNLVVDDKRWQCVVNCLCHKRTGKVVVYAFDKLHGRFLTRHLRYLGEKAEFVDGDTPLAVRNGIFERFRNGDTRILVNVKLLIEGVDCPAAESVLLTYPTQAQIRLHQMVGRVLRGPKIGGTPEGKVFAMEGSQQWLDRILFRGDYRFAGWNVKEL
jgi:superfamily II DNA or RNA helicase